MEATICPCAKRRTPELGLMSSVTGEGSLLFRVSTQFTEIFPWVPPFLTTVIFSNLEFLKRNIYSHIIHCSSLRWTFPLSGWPPDIGKNKNQYHEEQLFFNMKDMICWYLLGNYHNRNSLAYLNHFQSRKENRGTMVEEMTHTLKSSALCPIPQTLNVGIL